MTPSLRALLFALALTTVAVADLLPFPPVGGASYGYNIHYVGHPPPGALSMLKASGVSWIRTDFTWASIEKTKGVYNFTLYDQLTGDLTAHNLSAIYILDYGNPLYDDGLSPHTDSGREAFAKFAVASANHYATNPSILWEMWNEPNGGFWKPKPNATAYALLALAVGKALKESAPHAAYAGPATSGMDFSFIETCFKAGLLEYWDAVTVHPYRNDPPETAASDLAKLHAMIRNYTSRTDVRAVSSEWGYSARYAHYDVTRQSKVLPRMWLMNAVYNMSVSVWYDWVNDGTNQTYTEHHFGVVYHDYFSGRDPVYDAKPAYYAAMTFNRELEGCFVGMVFSTGQDYLHAVKFVCPDARQPLVIWCSDDVNIPCRLELKVAQSLIKFNQTNYVGQGLPPVSTTDSGTLIIDADNAPLYLLSATGQRQSL